MYWILQSAYCTKETWISYKLSACFMLSCLLVEKSEVVGTSGTLKCKICVKYFFVFGSSRVILSKRFVVMCCFWQESMQKFNRNRKVFCSILTNRCCSTVGTVFDADTIIFYDTDLNPSMDVRTQEWCDKIGRSKDIHIYRWDIPCRNVKV